MKWPEPHYYPLTHLGPARSGWCCRALRTRTPCRGRCRGPECSPTSGTSSTARRGRGVGCGGFLRAAAAQKDRGTRGKAALGCFCPPRPRKPADRVATQLRSAEQPCLVQGTEVELCGSSPGAFGSLPLCGWIIMLMRSGRKGHR